jgi:hypothetical protein
MRRARGVADLVADVGEALEAGVELGVLLAQGGQVVARQEAEL